MLHDSKEIHDFFRTMEEEACRRKAYICTYRIKDIESAIRTYKINKKALKDVHDYIGVWFILKDEKAILPIIDDLKGRFPDAEYIDFTDEESIYSPLVYIKWTPPLNYTILARETLIPNQISVPIEIRITWKEVVITLNDSRAAADLVSMLPLELTLIERNSFAKGITLPEHLSFVEPTTKEYEIGDFGYWDAGPDLAIFYDDMSRAEYS